MTKIMNDGALVGKKRGDFIAGNIPYIVRVKNGDWKPYIPNGEKQYNYKADSMSCVTFSAINAIEVQEFFLTGRFTEYSDRWTAKISGTTNQGNWLWKVADTIRNYGLVKEASYQDPVEPWTFDDWIADIPVEKAQELYNEGMNWKEKFSLAYEWIDVTKESFLYHLKHAPIQVVFPNHAVLMVACKEDVVSFFDTYEPWLKEKGLNEFISALKLVLTVKNMTKIFRINDHGKLGIAIFEGFTGTVVFAENMEKYTKLCEIYGVTNATPEIIVP